LAEGYKLMAGGMTLAEVCGEFVIAESRWHRWVARYGGTGANNAKQLGELEVRHSRL